MKCVCSTLIFQFSKLWKLQASRFWYFFTICGIHHFWFFCLFFEFYEIHGFALFLDFLLLNSFIIILFWDFAGFSFTLFTTAISEWRTLMLFLWHRLELTIKGFHCFLNFFCWYVFYIAELMASIWTLETGYFLKILAWESFWIDQFWKLFILKVAAIFQHYQLFF